MVGIGDLAGKAIGQGAGQQQAKKDSENAKKQAEREEESQEKVESELESLEETVEDVQDSQEAEAEAAEDAAQGPKKGFKLTSSVKTAAAGVGGALAAISLTSALKPKLTMGFIIIILSLLVDVLTTVLLMGGNPPLLFHIVWGIFLFYLVSDESGKRDPLVFIFLALNVLPAFLSWAFGNFLPESSISVFIANSIGNPFLPWWSIYAGFLKNPQSSKLLSIIFWLWILLFLAVGYTLGEEAISEIAGAQVDRGLVEGQKESFTSGFGFAVGSVANFVTDQVKLITQLPNSVKKWIEDVLNPGSQAEPEPERGIRIVETSFIQVSKKEKQFKASLQIEETGDLNNFLEVTDVECIHEDTGSWTKAEEVTKAAGKGENIKVYSRFRKTVTCPFFNEEEFDECPDEFNCLDEEAFEDLDRVKLFVDYDFTTKASLTSYIMREDLLEELLTDGQNPLDFIFKKGTADYGKKVGTTYNNGPASVSIGPIEFNTPPLGVYEDKDYPDFQLTIRNKPLFRGHITRIKDVSVKVPKGFTLGAEEDDSCPLIKFGNEYITSPIVIKEEELLFSDIKDKPKGFICGMRINATEALGDASFSQVAFEANVNFIYRVASSIG